MISAKELREKQSEAMNVSEQLELIEKAVLAASAEGRSKIRTYGVNGAFGAGDLYRCRSAAEYPPLVKAVIRELTALGYVATICCEERQFVDIFLEVSW